MNNQKIKVGILFGGKSAEHEFSLQSAKNVYHAINKKKYDPVLIGIDTAGTWAVYNDESVLHKNSLEPKDTKTADKVALVPQGSGKVMYITDTHQEFIVDVVFPVLHGPFGEDGTVQGLLKLANIPFVGVDVLGAAVGMDKDVMKRLLREADLPTAPYVVYRHYDEIPDYNQIKDKLGVPFFIKPANMGSSVGVSKIDNESQYKEGVAIAFTYDTKIIIEQYINGREIECAVLGNNHPKASIPGEIIVNDEFYSCQAKYFDAKAATTQIPALLSDTLIEQIQQLAIKTFQVLEGHGLARVDVFLDTHNKIWVNEINTIPGFTSISMYPQLWEASGIPYATLIDTLIQLAFERFDKQQQLETSYIK